MAIYYSNSTKGFYNTTVFDYPNLPDDIIEITAQEHNTYLSEVNSNGKIIVVEDGAIKLVDKPVPGKTWQNIRDIRNSLLLESDYTQLADFAGDKEVWATYRLALRNITTAFSTPEEVEFPQKPN
jgi:hypothetical protein